MGRTRRNRGGGAKDPFDHLAAERHDAEEGDPWFLQPDDAPELDLEAGISSNLKHDDLDE